MSADSCKHHRAAAFLVISLSYFGFWFQPHLRMFIGATPSHVLVLGLNLSTEFRQLVPSLPPATYSIPSSTATPALLRRLSMLAMAVHVLLCSMNCPEKCYYTF